MKKLIKILTIVVLLLIFITNMHISNAASIEFGGTTIEISSTEMPQINLDGNVKYIGIMVSLAIIFFIMYLGYRGDKKRENNNLDTSNNDIENEYPYEEESVNGDFLIEEKSMLDDELNENVEYEEESLFNTASDYIEKTEFSSMLDEEESITEKKDLIDETGLETEEFNFEENDANDFEELETFNNEPVEGFNFETSNEDINEFEEIETFDNEPVEEFNFETSNEDINEFEEIETFDNEPVEESIFETEEENSLNEIPAVMPDVQENSNLKRFTRKKQTNNKENEIVENNEMLNQYEYEEYEEDDEEDDVPTFDELLKKSEEEVSENIETFDFMAEMEKNLKNNKEKRLQKNTTIKSTTKKNEGASKKSTSKKTTTKKKKSDEE